MNIATALSSDLLKSTRWPAAIISAFAGLTPHILILNSPPQLRLTMILFIHALIVPAFTWFALWRLELRARNLERANDNLQKNADDLSRRNQQIDALNSACRLLSGAPSVSGILAPLAELTQKVAQAEGVTITWHEEDGSPLEEKFGAPCNSAIDVISNIDLVDADRHLGAVHLIAPATDEFTQKSLAVLTSEIALRGRLRHIEGNALNALYASTEGALGLNGEQQTQRLLAAMSKSVQAHSASLYVLRAGIWEHRVQHGQFKEIVIEPAGSDAGAWYSSDGKTIFLRGAADGILVLHGVGGSRRAAGALDLPLLRIVAGHSATLLRISDTCHEMLWAERQRIAHELHDDVCQSLASLHMQLGHLSDLITSGREKEAAERAIELRKDSLDAYDATRRAVDGFRQKPADGEQAHVFLERMARSVCERLGIALNVHVSAVRISSETAWHLGRVIQEAIYNAVQHAHAQEITLHLTGTGSIAELVVEDNGHFRARDGDVIASADIYAHHGLAIMKERVAGVKGRLEIQRKPGGTRLCVSVPIPSF